MFDFLLSLFLGGAVGVYLSIKAVFPDQHQLVQDGNVNKRVHGTMKNKVPLSTKGQAKILRGGASGGAFVGVVLRL